VAQEHLFGAATFSRPECPIIGWIQIQEAEALDRALNFQRISLDDIRNTLPGLFGAEGIKLNAVANDLSATGNSLERQAFANAWI
jgi:hypothetical protein